jgi:hypothetical protein
MQYRPTPVVSIRRFWGVFTPNSSIIKILFTHNVTKYYGCTFTVIYVTKTFKYFNNHTFGRMTLI